MEINNKDNTKGVKCEVLPNEKPLVETEKEIHNDYELVPRERDSLDLSIPINPLHGIE